MELERSVAAGALMVPACCMFSGANSAMRQKASVPFIRRESPVVAELALRGCLHGYSRWT
jgi:hypothetical protein